MLSRPQQGGFLVLRRNLSSYRTLEHLASAPVTLPPPSTTATPPIAPLPAPAILAPVRFPLSWLLEHASAPIRYRAMTEVARLPSQSADRLSFLPFTHRAALMLAMLQSTDGTWNRSMLTVPALRAEHFEGVGTISAVRRLLEYGWDRETPPLLLARRILFRLLAEDEDPEWLFEFGANGPADEDAARRGRAILREAAAAALAQAGYEGDPRLRGAAKRIIERVVGYLRSPLAQKPFIRVGNQHVLAAEAAPPSMFALLMLAYMPLFRTEHHDAMDRLYQHLAQPLPRQEPVQLCGQKVMAQPHLVLGDLLANRNVADADVPFAMIWLELVARLGFMRRNENWSKLFDRFLDDRDQDGVWHPHKGMTVARSANPIVWPFYPLEENLSGDERWADVTFRLGLIARVIGRTIEIA
jgi:hypothetical protein